MDGVGERETRLRPAKVRPRRTPLDRWVAGKIRSARNPSSLLSRDELDRYHLERLREVIDYSRRNSTFYRQRLKTFRGGDLEAPGDLALLPFTCAEDLRSSPTRFLCVSQDEVTRVVTLDTSGTTGLPKRLFFTNEDLELTVDFFHHGMSTLVSPGQRVLILLPGEKKDSVGDLLKRALARMDVQGIVHGPVYDVNLAMADIAKFSVDCLVGIPTQVLWIARKAGKTVPRGRIKSVLLSTDYIPQVIVRELERLWGCPAFTHYGMTETGLGGAVECEARCGYHIREADLYVEIVDPVSARPCRRGETGEIVFTTLTRRGMPLIRYRTGDISRIIAEPCPCGSVLSRLGRVEGRLDGAVSIGRGHALTIAELDEVLFAVPGLFNYSAEVVRSEGKERLILSVYAGAAVDEQFPEQVSRAAWGVETIRRAVEEGLLTVAPPRFLVENQITTGVEKRKIEVRSIFSP